MLRSENLLTLVEARASLNPSVHPCTFRRWCSRGVRGIRLETLLVGGRRFTSREAIDRFIAATTAAAAFIKSEQAEQQLDLFDNHAAATGRGKDPDAAAVSNPPARSAAGRRVRG